ncbi:helix-turn-helix domain-containing protein [Winogradskyella haliclonae]|uniref:HTH araC/xylS-type domain-containing protein n=1 Tax=Winogradskyella haliclonae TaxID=2048558 RepID=A0ABQ2BYK4_9FLAO|nr:helix-turn-helix domain-containing protein [Winogradskyella haliclonae]GGI57591.1 hypothetical protein GCM10011444_19000 [Winogradskyella haliclonae]
MYDIDRNIVLLGIFSGIAVTTNFFIAVYLILIKKRDKYENTLLGLLFIAIGLRIIKSIIHFIFIDVFSLGLSFGFLGLSCAGPLLYVYMCRMVNKKIEFYFKTWMHFIIPVIGTITCLFVDFKYVVMLYKTATFIFLAYLLASLFIHIRNTYHETNIKLWNSRLLLVISVIWFSFLIQHITPFILQYALWTGLASLSIYYIFFAALKSPIIFKKNTDLVPLSILKKVKKAFEEEKLYMEKSITLTKFSIDSKIPIYLVTQSVKQLYGKRFPEVVNHFRIEDVKTMLLNNRNRKEIKVEALAYEVGFNSPSAFYVAFKKETGMSPRDYQDKHFQVKSNLTSA